jgi:hypothetical protein
VIKSGEQTSYFSGGIGQEVKKALPDDETE